MLNNKLILMKKLVVLLMLCFICVHLGATIYTVNYSNVILPVNLLSFNALYNQNVVELDWTISDEENISDYSIERSIDGIHFTSINSQSSMNSSIQKNYNAVDANFPDDANKLYYRLRITGLSGSLYYSKVIVVNINSSNADLNISPNPAKNFININFSTPSDGDYAIDIIDVKGAVVNHSHKILTKGKNSWAMNGINNLSAGTYIIRLSNGTDFQYTRFLFMP